jgi:hypothetical protein
VSLAQPSPELSSELRERLARGEHESVAAELEQGERHGAAAHVREMIWDFAGAARAWTRAGEPLLALAAALQDGGIALVDEAVGALDAIDEFASLQRAVELLQRHRRHHDAARLLARTGSAPNRRADALLRAGDRVGAATVLAAADQTLGALHALGELGEGTAAAAARALAASLSWDLGDAEAAARHAQIALRGGAQDPELVALLARALATLGHELAAEIVLPQREHDTVAVPGRFRVTGTHATGLCGAAYVGIDRTTLRPVEIHLLLADLPDLSAAEGDVLLAIDRFATIARAAASLGHPAIRPILELRAEAGLLVLPRAQGPLLRELVRPPGLLAMPSRARALAAFLLEGLIAAHERGLVHGWLLPSQIVCDALGRPQLGPFGAHHLAGLAATHTGSLEELLAVTAPELRGGAAPSIESDMFALGALLRALVRGRFDGSDDEDDDDDADSPELELARALQADEPGARPQASAVLAQLRAPVAHVRELEGAAVGDEPVIAAPIEVGRGQPSLSVEAAPSWSDAELDALCGATNPWWQPILDRQARRIVLAAWPTGCRGLGDDARGRWRELVPAAAWPRDSEPLQAAFEQRIAPTTLVRTAGGEWMLALDDLLSR